MTSSQGICEVIHNPQVLLQTLQFSKEILRVNEENLQAPNRGLAKDWEYQR